MGTWLVIVVVVMSKIIKTRLKKPEEIFVLRPPSPPPPPVPKHLMRENVVCVDNCCHMFVVFVRIFILAKGN